MKTFGLILKILAVLSAIAGIVYILATYGDKIVAWAKKLLGCCPCTGDCDDCQCDGDCDTCACDACEEEVEVLDAENIAVPEAPAEEAPAEEVPAAPAEESPAPETAEEQDFAE